MTNFPEKGHPHHELPVKLPDQPISNPSEADLVAEDERFRLRRIEIDTLVLDFLNKRNPGADSEGIERYYRSRYDIFTDEPLDQLQEKEEAGKNELEGYEDALAIARFYWENRENLNVAEVPDRAIIVDDGKVPEIADPSEKVLVYINERSHIRGKQSVYEFSGRRKRLFRGEVSQTRPDVFLSKVNDFPSLGVHKEKFTIDGCQNLMIGTRIVPSFVAQDGGGYEIDTLKLACKGECVVFPGAVLKGGRMTRIGGEDFISKIDIKASTGDIVQYPGSYLAVQNMLCQKFVQNGGILAYPNPDAVKIQYYRDVRFNGEKPSEKYLVLRNLNSVDDEPTDLESNILARRIGLPSPPSETGSRVAEMERSKDTEIADEASAASPTNEGELAEDADKDIGERPTSLTDLQEIFFAVQEPNTRLVRAEESGDVEVRGYDLTTLSSSQITELATYAAAAGWKILTSPEGTMVVQKKQNPSKPQE